MKYSGALSGTLEDSLRRAKVPDSLARQVSEAVARDPHFPRLSRHSSGSYELLAVRHRRQLKLVEARVHADHAEHRLLRGVGSLPSAWVDGHGHILSDAQLVKPVSGGRMSSGFGWRIHPVLGDRRFHNGVDFALPKGSPVFAAEGGVVKEVGFHGNYGKLVRIGDGRSTECVYAHLNGFAAGLRVGERVDRGQLIGYVGESGLATGPHLYWEVKKDGDHVDPLRLLREPKRLPPQQMAQLLHYVAKLEKTADAPAAAKTRRHEAD